MDSDCLFAGLQDELIPPWHMRVLYNASPDVSGGGKRLFTVRDGAHNDTWEKGGTDYLKAITSFIDEVSLSGAATSECL